MDTLVYLVRHAESEHNVSKDFSQRDPPLTTNGLTQASSLKTHFPDASSVAVVLTSPLTRAIQTTLAGFSQIIAGKSNDHNGEKKSATLIIDRDLQERSDLPCDTGSELALLCEAFPSLDFSRFGHDWFAKTGLYAADHASVSLRAQKFRETLWNLSESWKERQPSATTKMSIVVVTHGVFMKYLSQDMDIDLPKAGWQVFRLQKNSTNEIRLTPG